MCKFRIYLLILIAVIFNFTACSKTYKIGDNCPAGGIVFFDKGVKQDGWRYLSAAPAGTEFEAEWGEVYIQDTSTGIGTGKQNTQLIADVLNQRGEKNRAAQLCLNLKVGRFSDWFLPSKDELAQMYISLRQRGLGNFGDNWYLSSSQDDYNVGAWVQFFDDGLQDGSYKAYAYRVRAVRAF